MIDLTDKLKNADCGFIIACHKFDNVNLIDQSCLI